MERDKGLILEILGYLAKNEDFTAHLGELATDEVIGGSFGTLEGHLLLCADVGFVEVMAPQTYRLTWAGHNAVEQRRDNENWTPVI